MQHVDATINLIRDGRRDEALAMLDASPELARAHSDATRQLHGASPLHWAGQRNAVKFCQRLLELGADVKLFG
jgi:hypothetical protein